MKKILGVLLLCLNVSMFFSQNINHEDVVKARELSDSDKERYSVESGKKVVEKNKIKKAKTAFMLYSMKQRTALAKENVKGKVLMNRIGESWAALKKSTKKKDIEELKSLAKKAEDDKQRYKAEKEAAEAEAKEKKDGEEEEEEEEDEDEEEEEDE